MRSTLLFVSPAAPAANVTAFIFALFEFCQGKNRGTPDVTRQCDPRGIVTSIAHHALSFCNNTRVNALIRRGFQMGHRKDDSRTGNPDSNSRRGLSKITN